MKSVTTAGGAVAGVASLALLIGAAVSMQAASLVGRAYQTAYPLPAALRAVLPASQRSAAPGSTAAATDPVVKRALWFAPLDPQTFNIFLVGETNAGAPAAKLDADAAALSRLSWRTDAAQRTLMLRALGRADLAQVLDRADGLLRRRRVIAETQQLLQALEIVPQTHRLVVERLLSGVPWRDEYLVGTGRYPSAVLASARLATLDSMIRAGRTPPLPTVAPFLTGLSGMGRAQDAYALWRRSYRPASRDSGIVNDAGFAAIVPANASTPFDWQYATGPGFAAMPGDHGGLDISWDGRGVPVFATQRVPVVAGRRYALTLTGARDAARLLALMIGCGEQRIAITPTRRKGDAVAYAFIVPANTCAMPELTIGGALQDSAAPVTLHVSSLRIVPAG